MPISPRGGSFQVTLYHNQSRIRKSLPSRQEAEKWELMAKMRLSQGLDPEEIIEESKQVGDGWTLEKLAKATETRFWTGKANERNNSRIADELVGFFGKSTDPSSINPTKIDQWREALKGTKNNSPGTINRKLACLSKMLKFAEQRGIIPKVPHMDREKESQGRLRWYTHEEEAKVLAYLETANHPPVFRSLIIFLVDTGCRLSEALNLQWRDMDMVYVRFHHTKNGQPRAVPLTSRLRGLLTKPASVASTDLVFPGWTPSRASHHWERIRAAVGFNDPEACLHAWRHTCASRLAQAGVPIQQIQQWLGHKTIQMTLRYAHLCPQNLTAAVSALERTPLKIRTEAV